MSIFFSFLDSIVVRQALVDYAPWPIVPEEDAHATKEEPPVLPQWLLDAAIDVEEAIEEILEKRQGQ